MNATNKILLVTMSMAVTAMVVMSMAVTAIYANTDPILLGKIAAIGGIAFLILSFFMIAKSAVIEDVHATRRYPAY